MSSRIFVFFGIVSLCLEKKSVKRATIESEGKTMKILNQICLLLLLAQPAFAIGFGPEPKTGIGLLEANGTDDYRLGDTWGKVPVTDVSRESPAFRRAALATAKVGGATGFFLGKFEGVYVMATNHHVYPRSCVGSRVKFPLLNVEATCEQFYGSWPEIDLALFAVRFNNAADANKMMEVAANFQFHEDVQLGQRLLTIGFGVAGNSMRQEMANQDSDCYVFSGTGEYRLMADPDDYNPGSYRAWSFANGCDVSHGDSGSAMVDRASGKVVGIIWTGKIPKNENVQNSSYLDRLFSAQTQEIWTELSYAVPAKKMGDFLQDQMSHFDEPTRKVISALLK